MRPGRAQDAHGRAWNGPRAAPGGPGRPKIAQERPGSAPETVPEPSRALSEPSCVADRVSKRPRTDFGPFFGRCAETPMCDFHHCHQCFVDVGRVALQTPGRDENPRKTSGLGFENRRPAVPGASGSPKIELERARAAQFERRSAVRALEKRKKSEASASGSEKERSEGE